MRSNALTHLSPTMRAASLAWVAAFLALPLAASALPAPSVPLITAGPWGAWEFEDVELATTLSLHRQSLALTDAGRPLLVMAVDHGQGWHINLYERVGPAWLREVVAPGRQASIALGSQDDIHLSYSDHAATLAGMHLHYSRRVGSDWVIEDIGTTAGASELHLDAGDAPHIVFWGGGLRYAYRSTSGVWTIESGPSVSGDSVTRFDSALDSTGRPHILFHKSSGSLMKYAYRTGPGTWNVEFVNTCAPSIDYGIAIDVQDRVHVACNTPNGLRYMMRVGASWTQPEVITTNHDIGFDAALAVDHNAVPHVSYSNRIDWLGSRMHYATRTAAGWVNEIADPTIALNGYESTIRVDAFGRPHIAYELSFHNLPANPPNVVLDLFAGNLRYATPIASAPNMAVGVVEVVARALP